MADKVIYYAVVNDLSAVNARWPVPPYLYGGGWLA